MSFIAFLQQSDIGKISSLLPDQKTRLFTSNELQATAFLNSVQDDLGYDLYQQYLDKKAWQNLPTDTLSTVIHKIENVINGLHHSIEMSPSYKDLLIKDKEDYEQILDYLDANRLEDAKKFWESLETAAREYLFENIGLSEAKQIAEFFNTELNEKAFKNSSLKFSNDTYFDSTPSQEVEPEDRNFTNPLSDEKLRRTNPKRYEVRRDWYNDPMSEESQGYQNRADEVIAKLEAVEWEINKYIDAGLSKTASVNTNTFINKLKERYDLIEKIAWKTKPKSTMSPAGLIYQILSLFFKDPKGNYVRRKEIEEVAGDYHYFQYLLNKGYVERIERGFYRATEKGKEVYEDVQFGLESQASENEQVVITYEGFPQDVKEFVEDYFKDIIEKYPDLKEHLKSVKIIKAERPEHYPQTTGAEYDTGDNSISAYIDIEKIFGELRQGLVHELTHAVQVFLDGREEGIPALPKELDDKYYSGDLQFYWQNPLEEHAYKVEKEFKKRHVHASLCLNWQTIFTKNDLLNMLQGEINERGLRKILKQSLDYDAIKKAIIEAKNTAREEGIDEEGEDNNGNNWIDIYYDQQQNNPSTFYTALLDTYNLTNDEYNDIVDIWDAAFYNILRKINGTLRESLNSLNLDWQDIPEKLDEEPTYWINEDDMWEIFDRAQEVPGDLPRVQDATLIEQLRYDAGFSFDDRSYDSDIIEDYCGNPQDLHAVNYWKEIGEKVGVTLRYEEVHDEENEANDLLDRYDENGDSLRLDWAVLNERILIDFVEVYSFEEFFDDGDGGEIDYSDEDFIAGADAQKETLEKDPDINAHGELKVIAVCEWEKADSWVRHTVLEIDKNKQEMITEELEKYDALYSVSLITHLDEFMSYGWWYRKVFENSTTSSLKLGSSYDEYTDKNKTLFESRYENYGDDGGKLFWSSSFGQRKRFEALLDFTQDPKKAIENMTILDVGCGYGDFISFIKEKFDTEKINYTGTELVQQMIDVAIQKHPNAKFELRDIVKQPYPDNSFDLVIGSGLFALNHPQWAEFVLQLVNSMYKVSRKVVAVNFLQNHETDDNFKYTTPKEVYKILSKITKDLKIERGYLPDDFTVFLYKDLNSLKLEWSMVSEFKVGDKVIDSANDTYRVVAILSDGYIGLEETFKSGLRREGGTIWMSPDAIIEFELRKINN